MGVQLNLALFGKSMKPKLSCEASRKQFIDAIREYVTSITEMPVLYMEGKKKALKIWLKGAMMRPFELKSSLCYLACILTLLRKTVYGS